MRVRTGRNEVIDLGPTDARRGDLRKSERQRQVELRNDHLRRKYGLTGDEYDRLLAAQGGLCAICRQPERLMGRGRVRRLAVDHDHRTGRVRGLLCASCNTILGHLRDDPAWASDFVVRMTAYLRADNTVSSGY